MSSGLRLALTSAILLLVLVPSVMGATITVTGGANSLQQAHDNASPGDILELDNAGVNAGASFTSNQNQVLKITKAITIRAKIPFKGDPETAVGPPGTGGPGGGGGTNTEAVFMSAAKIDGENTRMCIEISTGSASDIVVLEGMAIMRGQGVGLKINSGTVTITGVYIYGNHAAVDGNGDGQGAGGVVVGYVTDSAVPTAITVTIADSFIFNNGAGPLPNAGVNSLPQPATSTLPQPDAAPAKGVGGVRVGPAGSMTGPDQAVTVTIRDTAVFANAGTGIHLEGEVTEFAALTVIGSSIYSNKGQQSTADGISATSILRSGGISATGGVLSLRSNRFWDNSVAGAGCSLEVAADNTPGITAEKKHKPLFNNTFLADGVRARWALPSLIGPSFAVPNACESGIMINFYADAGFECEPGKWMSPSPYTSAPATFTGCRFECDAGTYGSTTTLTTSSCTAPCTIGHYCPKGSSTPTPCPINTYMATTGGTVCSSCPALSTTAITGATSDASCQCVKGFFKDADTSGAALCTACPDGATTTAAGATSASQCSCLATRFLSIDATTGAASCPQCKDVVQFSSSSVDGATSVDACECNLGYYLEMNGTSKKCVACDASMMDCSVPGVTVANMPIQPGGWRISNDTSIVHKCFNWKACVGNPGIRATVNSTTRRRLAAAGTEASTAGDALCAIGHTGFLCGTCAAQCHGYSDTALCQACASSMGTGFLPLLIFLLAVLILIAITCKSKSKKKKALEAKIKEKIDESVWSKKKKTTLVFPCALDQEEGAAQSQSPFLLTCRPVRTSALARVSQ